MPDSNLFGHELVFEREDTSDICGIAVRVNRPPINLENFIEIVWSELSEKCQESHSDTKVYFMLF